MDAYYVPPELMDILQNTTQRLALSSSGPTQVTVDLQKFNDDLEFIFYVNGNRIWTVRFSSR